MIDQEWWAPGWAVMFKMFNSKSIQHEMAQQAKAWPAIAGSRPSVKLRFSPLYQMYQSGTKVLTASVKERADGQKMPHHNSNVIYLLDLPQSVTDDEQSWWSCLETLTRQTWKSAEMKVNMHLDNEQMLLLTKLTCLYFANSSFFTETFKLQKLFWFPCKYSCTGGHSGLHVSSKIPLKLSCGMEKKPTGSWSTKSTV